MTAVAAGTAFITATSEGKSGTSSITVTPIPVASVSVSLSATPIQVGQTTQATATAFDASNNILTGRVVTWSTGNAAVASVSSSGVVTTVAVGSTTIIATSEGKTRQRFAHSDCGSCRLGDRYSRLGNRDCRCHATTFRRDERREQRRRDWSHGGLVLEQHSGRNCRRRGARHRGFGGRGHDHRNERRKERTSSITVIPVPVASVTVALSPNSITAVGTAQASATTFDGNGAALTGRVVTWSSGNTAVATVSAQGVVTAIAVGTASITATSEGKSGSATLTVTQAPVASVTVSPASATVMQGGTEQLSVTLKDAHDNVLARPVTWSSSDDPIATVSQSGLVSRDFLRAQRRSPRPAKARAEHRQSQSRPIPLLR